MNAEHPGSPLLSTLDARVEALLFATSRPVTVAEISDLLPLGADVAGAVDRIASFWSARGVTVHHGAEGFSMRAVRDLLPPDSTAGSRRLSEAALATLAAIAMHQPITVAEIERVRGVTKLTRNIIDSLKTAGLILESGRRSGSGSAVAYVVSEKFLERFDIEQLSDLPTPEEALALDLEAPLSSSPASAMSSD